MTASERITNLIRGKSFDRLPVIEWAPWWHLTVERWVSEGVPQKETASVYSLQKYLGLDACLQTYFPAITAATPQPAYHGAPIINNKDDYLKIKKTLYPDVTKAYSKEHYEFLRKTRADGDTVHFYTIEGFFWFPRTLLGIEQHLYSFYDQPEFYKEICHDYSEWAKTVIGFIGNTFKFDFMSFAEDMSYNHGPMLSKETFDEFLLPFYKDVIKLIKKTDIPVFVDSDGDITKAVDWYAEAGAEGMFPLERQAGVDVAKYIEKQPQMTFLGHYDKMCMKFGEKAMREEFERILPSAKKGRVIISVDHQTPPDVSLENYRTYVGLFKEYAKLGKRE